MLYLSKLNLEFGNIAFISFFNRDKIWQHCVYLNKIRLGQWKSQVWVWVQQLQKSTLINHSTSVQCNARENELKIFTPPLHQIFSQKCLFLHCFYNSFICVCLYYCYLFMWSNWYAIWNLLHLIFSSVFILRYKFESGFWSEFALPFRL